MPYVFEEDVPGFDIGFDISIPDGWTQYDLTGDAVARLRAQAVEMYANRPEELNALNDLLAEIAEVTNDARRGGLLAAAGTFDKYDDGFFMATVCVFSFPAGQGEQALDPIRMMEFVYSDDAVAREGTWLRKTMVELPDSGADQCGRIYGVTDYSMEDTIVRSVVMHTSFAVPGLDRRVMVSCTSPNALQLEEVLDLFDAITGTARFWARETGTGGTGGTV